MKWLLVLAVTTTLAQCATLSPRDEAAELLLETAQLDQTLQKRSFNSAPSYSNYNAYSDTAYPVKPAQPSFDLWGFNRAILSALYNAVRAVAGGSIAVKGHIIKTGGNLVESQGRLIASGGQAVSNFGRNLASNAAHDVRAQSYQPTYNTYTTGGSYVPGSGYGGQGGQVVGPYQHEQPGVLESLQKAKVGVASAVGNAVVGAAGAVGSAVGNAVGHAVVGAAGAAARAVSGAAESVSNHVANKYTPTHAPVAVPVVYKESHAVRTPIHVADSTASAVPYPVATYGGSLAESFGNNEDFIIQPSISYDLHH